MTDRNKTSIFGDNPFSGKIDEVFNLKPSKDQQKAAAERHKDLSAKRDAAEKYNMRNKAASDSAHKDVEAAARRRSAIRTSQDVRKKQKATGALIAASDTSRRVNEKGKEAYFKMLDIGDRIARLERKYGKKIFGESYDSYEDAKARAHEASAEADQSEEELGMKHPETVKKREIANAEIRNAMHIMTSGNKAFSVPEV